MDRKVTQDVGEMPAGVFRRCGALLEVNRRVLFPVGLGLTVDPTVDGGVLRAYRFRDHGDACSHVHFSAETKERAQAFAALEAQEHPPRFAALGFVVQPLPGEVRSVRALEADVDGVWAFVEAAVAMALESLPLSAMALEDGTQAFEEWAANVVAHHAVAPLLERLHMVSEDGGSTWRWRLDAGRPAFHGCDLARCHYLVAEIERLQLGGEPDVGDASTEIRDYAARAKGELFPAEVEEFEALKPKLAVCDHLFRGDESEGDFSSNVEDIRVSLERLYALAQPGMRVYRGDANAVDAFQGHRERLRAAARATVQTMTDHERLVCGDLSDYDDADWRALEARAASDLERATAAVSDADAAMAAAIQARDAAMRAMDTVTRALARRAEV